MQCLFLNPIAWLPIFPLGYKYLNMAIPMKNVPIPPVLIKHLYSECTWDGLQTFQIDFRGRDWNYSKIRCWMSTAKKVGVEKSDEETAEFLESASQLYVNVAAVDWIGSHDHLMSESFNLKPKSLWIYSISMQLEVELKAPTQWRCEWRYLLPNWITFW